jgi:hypothetical protein
VAIARIRGIGSRWRNWQEFYPMPGSCPATLSSDVQTMG